MTSYLVEVYAPAGNALDHAVTRARAAAAAMAQEGIAIRHLRAIHVPEDETAFHLFEGPSAEAISEVSRRASLPYARIAEAVEAEPVQREMAGVEPMARRTAAQSHSGIPGRKRR